MTQPQDRAQWKSRLGFILAAAGSAIGLGNIWKFPYITGENGGGLFVLIYLVCIVLVGIPIMMSEILIGRAAQKQPVAAFHTLQGERTGWASVGWLGVLAGFVILSYYIVVAGWAVDYTLKSVVNFTAPVREEAAAAAMRYRASESLDEMRKTLAEKRAAHRGRDEIARIRAEAKPSVWRAYARFLQAVQAAPSTFADGGDSTRAIARGRARLLSDPTLRVQIEEAERLTDRIRVVEQEAAAEAAAHFAALADESVLAEAETLKRRDVIFESVSTTFLAVASDGWTCTLWSAIFMVVTIAIVAGGIARGIERTCRVLMPALLVLILVMVGYGTTRSGFGEALSFVFMPAPEKLKASGVLEALGHAFFTLSLGMGAMITYGSYQRTKEGLLKESVAVALLDTAIALLACLMIFPIIFSYGQEPAAGPGLVFMSMPLAFAEIGTGGMLLAIFFFGLLVFAALTSAISLLEVVVSYFIDEHGFERSKATWIIGAAVFAFGIPSAFSLDSDFLMDGWEPSFGKNFFDTMDYLASNWMLPLGGLFIAIYTGWVLPKATRDIELEGTAEVIVKCWLLLIRFVAPALVILVLLQKVGILDADEFFHGMF